jgi:hypothetical protein
VKEEGFNRNITSVIQQACNDYSKKLLISVNFDVDTGNKQAALFFKNYNIEHTGHNIA